MPFHFDKWRHALYTAPNEGAVLGVVRDYIGTLAPELLARLPEHCREALLHPNLTVQDAAVTCLQAEMRYEGEPETRAILHELAHTLAAASLRITSLHGGQLSR